MRRTADRTPQGAGRRRKEISPQQILDAADRLLQRHPWVQAREVYYELPCSSSRARGNGYADLYRDVSLQRIARILLLNEWICIESRCGFSRYTKPGHTCQKRGDT